MSSGSNFVSSCMCNSMTTTSGFSSAVIWRVCAKLLAWPRSSIPGSSCRRRPIIRSIKSESSASRTEQRVASAPRWESRLILEGKNGSTQSVFCLSNWEHPIGYGPCRSVRFVCAGQRPRIRRANALVFLGFSPRRFANLEWLQPIRTSRRLSSSECRRWIPRTAPLCDKSSKLTRILWGSRALRTDVRCEFLVALLFVMNLHLVNRFANGRP